MVSTCQPKDNGDNHLQVTKFTQTASTITCFFCICPACSSAFATFLSKLRQRFVIRSPLPLHYTKRQFIFMMLLLSPLQYHINPLQWKLGQRVHPALTPRSFGQRLDLCVILAGHTGCPLPQVQGTSRTKPQCNPIRASLFCGPAKHRNKDQFVPNTWITHMLEAHSTFTWSLEEEKGLGGEGGGGVVSPWQLTVLFPDDKSFSFVWTTKIALDKLKL